MTGSARIASDAFQISEHVVDLASALALAVAICRSVPVSPLLPIGKHTPGAAHWTCLWADTQTTVS